MIPFHFGRTRVKPKGWSASFNSVGSFDEAPGHMIKTAFVGALDSLRLLEGAIVRLCDVGSIFCAGCIVPEVCFADQMHPCICRSGGPAGITLAHGCNME